jgi:hypothetical protein
MLKHAGELARELFQDTLFEPPPSRVVDQRLEAVVPVRENRQAHTQELSFGARPFILCGLPIRRLPVGTRAYTRRNGKFFLEVVGHPHYGIPFGQDRLVLLWLATEAVRTRSPVVRFESASQILTDWGLTTGGEYYRRLASSFRRVFGSTIFFGTQAERGRSEIWDCSRIHFVDQVRLWFQHDCETDGRRRDNLVTLSAPFWEELRNHRSQLMLLSSARSRTIRAAWICIPGSRGGAIRPETSNGSLYLAHWDSRASSAFRSMHSSANSASVFEAGWNWFGSTGPNARRGSQRTGGFSSWRMLRRWGRGDLDEQSTR